MKKLLLLLSLSLLTVTSALAEVSKADLIKAIKGKYVLSINEYFSGNDVAGSFLIRSTGKLQVLDIDDGKERISGASISYNFSNSDHTLSGLPVAHLTFLYGSDEDSLDYHVLLTVNKIEGKLELVKISSFITFNDGPNDMSEYLGQTSNFALKKYNKRTRRYKLIK